ncbi:DUF2147 domain-containing protein [Spongiivirga sp. MCCC 1A20706]|uniref:DUF2147 domain-containing protein n=1 Tax=Spongiivirga sp. MCCC 1A20706 TaxID=3160963 RepID=UPI0039778EDB
MGEIKYLLLLLLVVVVILIGCGNRYYINRQVSADDILGIYVNPDKSRTVKVYKENGQYFGIIHSAPDEPDGSEGIGFIVFKNFVFDQDDKTWKEGKLHSPMYARNVFPGTLRLDTNKNLIVRGFIGFKFLGGNSIFPRQN